MNSRTPFFIAITAMLILAIQPCAQAGLKASGKPLPEQIGNDAQFARLLTRQPWSWEHKPPYTPHPITFGTDGTLKQSNGWTAKWAITGDREVTVTLRGRRAVLHFNRAVSAFRGIDFDGYREIWGDISGT